MVSHSQIILRFSFVFLAAAASFVVYDSVVEKKVREKLRNDCKSKFTPICLYDITQLEFSRFDMPR